MDFFFKVGVVIRLDVVVWFVGGEVGLYEGFYDSIGVGIVFVGRFGFGFGVRWVGGGLLGNDVFGYVFVE